MLSKIPVTLKYVKMPLRYYALFFSWKLRVEWKAQQKSLPGALTRGGVGTGHGWALSQNHGFSKCTMTVERVKHPSL